ncbi:MAG: hypothetical protein JWP59_4712 [Massilia sp.]|nr:hypothetical protein [Massilia sp.]
MATSTVLISILNWNKAQVTLDCLASLRAMKRDAVEVEVLVIDNGSNEADFLRLQAGVDTGWVKLLRLEKNLGFTGGHNIAFKMAMEKNYDYLWLLNNDATVQDDTLEKLVRTISADPRCGAVSPVIYGDDGDGHLNGWGATHDWRARDNAWIPSAEASMKLHETDPASIFLVGTAIMFRVEALREVGLLDDRLFAYYDDNDIGTRLANRGWHSKVVFDAGATHGSRDLKDQPPYFFYLMFRNELIFWHTHMPSEHRRLLWLKLVNQAIFNANRLRRRHMPKQADAALLGVWHFICGRDGEPQLQRRLPATVKLLAKLLALLNQKQLAESDNAAALA